MTEREGDRIARLTELAQTAWQNDSARVYADTMRGFGSVTIADSLDAARHRVVTIEHSRALDALEAALCVLAQEPLPEAEERHAKLVSVADKLNRLRHDLELLAAQWERDAGTSHCDDAGDAYVQCAKDLRKRAKEEQ